MQPIPRTAIAAAAVAVAACSTRDTPTTSPDPIHMSVEVRNDHWRPLRVWAVWPGARHYLGEVQPSQRQLYRIPGPLLRHRGDVRLMAESVGTAEEVTTSAVASTSPYVRWRLGRHLLSSRPHVF